MSEDRRGAVNGRKHSAMKEGKTETMDDDKNIRFAKIRRIAAMIGVIILAGIYITALLAAIGNWENSHAVFMTAVYLSIAVPVIIYVIMLIHRYSNKKDEKTDENKTKR